MKVACRFTATPMLLLLTLLVLSGLWRMAFGNAKAVVNPVEQKIDRGSEATSVKKNAVEVEQIGLQFPESSTLDFQKSDPFGSIIEGRTNVFFDESKFVQDWLSNQPNAIAFLQSFLSDHSELEKLSSVTSIIQERPKPVLERMAAVDILIWMMNQRNDYHLADNAKGVLEKIVIDEINPSLNDVTKKVLLGEKMDAMTALAENEPRRAINIITQIKSVKLSKAFKAAALAGMVDSGMRHEEAVKWMNDGLPSLN